jgi:CDP-L-myo-inositol myo-inositolphosphotransferase
VKALILAAGEGKRLKELTKEKPKALIKLGGIPLLLRVLESIREVGIIKEVYISIGYEGDKILKKIGRNYKGIKIDYLKAKGWEKGNLYSFLAAKEVLKENFLLLMSDHLYDPRILREILKEKLNSSVILAVDKKKDGEEEDTKVIEREGKVLKIGKGVKGNTVDTGLFFCSPKIFYYAKIARKKGKSELAECVNEAAKNRDAQVFYINEIETYVSGLRKEVKPFWLDIDTKEDIKKGKKLLIENSSKGASDFLAYYVHKPIENRIIYYLSDFSFVTANKLTILTNLVAYLITFLFLTGHLLIASILTFVVGILDGLDGKLARVRNHSSKLGSLEHSFDLLFEFSWFIALALFLFNSTKSSLPLILCIGIILSISFYRNVYDQFRKAMGKSLDDAGEFERKFRRIAGRRNLYNIPIFIGILIGIPLYALYFILFHSGLTALVYSLRAMKHMYNADK